MSIGYACIAVGVPDTGMKSCLLQNVSEERLSQIIAGNLKALENIIDYNIENGIKLFRISSDLIPFGSHPANTLRWWELFDMQLQNIGNKIRNNGLRVSMHPGQYTVLNSPDNGVVDRAVQDLIYHAGVLDSLGSGTENKIILHIGGVYHDKKQSAERFITNYNQLPDNVKQRLVIENDDKSYNICEVLEIGRKLNIPVVFDNLHNLANPADKKENVYFWINECHYTWQKKDGTQKVHYSQQDKNKKQGSHSDSIHINEFLEFYRGLENSNIDIISDLDIMLEVKDKNLSAIKCINCTSGGRTIKALEIEWSRYKYNVLEKSPQSYIEIRRLLKNKNEYPAIQFYQILEASLKQPEVPGYSVNAAQHVWGYFKDTATAMEKDVFQKNMKAYQNNEISLQILKRGLWKLAVRYKQQYLLDSYYFI